MKTFYTATFIVIALSGGSAFATTINAKVNGMVCAFCAQGIEKKLRAQAATKDLYVSLENKVVAVELKPGQDINDDAMKQIISDAGYAVTAISRSEESVDAIRQSMKKK
ncbi:MAG: heavy metal-associated domain-containing protein [Burkholderiales bacterium]